MMTSFLAAIGLIYLCVFSTRVLFTAYRTIQGWSEMKSDEPEIKKESLRNRLAHFLFLFVALWFFLPLNAVASLQKDEK